MDCVIFDMDGTLIDSSEDITLAVNHVRKKVYGLAPLEREEVVAAINRDHRNLALLFYGTEEYEPRAKSVFEPYYYKQCIENTYVYDGVEDVLNHLRQRDILLAVATNAPAIFGRRMLSGVGLLDFFPCLVGGDEVEKPKPDGEMIFQVKERLALSEEARVIMVGDNEKDMAAARKAGVGEVFANWGFAKPPAGTRVIIDKPQELLDHIGQAQSWFEKLEI